MAHAGDGRKTRRALLSFFAPIVRWAVCVSACTGVRSKPLAEGGGIWYIHTYGTISHSI